MNYSANIDHTEVAKFNAMAGQWWEPNGPCAPLHILNPTRLLYIQRHVKLTNKKILDVGCGAGILTESLASAGGNVTGIDASIELITAAKTHAAMQNLAIDYQNCTIEEFISNQNNKCHENVQIPARTCSASGITQFKELCQFDIITCMELIEHVPDPAKLVADCARLLKPGGQMFLSTLNRTPKAYALAIIGAEYLLKILPKHTHDYKKFIRPAELATMLKNTNLTLQNLSGLRFDPFTKSAHLQDDLRVNYLAYATKEI